MRRRAGVESTVMKWPRRRDDWSDCSLPNAVTQLWGSLEKWRFLALRDIGGFALPGFDTGGRKLRAFGTVRASNMLHASRTLTSTKRPIRRYLMALWTLRSPPSYQFTDTRLRGVPAPTPILAGILMRNTLEQDMTDTLDFLASVL